jgi:hypothetical protein
MFYFVQPVKEPPVTCGNGNVITAVTRPTTVYNKPAQSTFLNFETLFVYSAVVSLCSQAFQFCALRITLAHQISVNVRKANFALKQATKGPEEEYRLAVPIFLTTALDGVGGQRHTPVALLPGKLLVSIVQEAE